MVKLTPRSAQLNAQISLLPRGPGPVGLALGMLSHAVLMNLFYGLEKGGTPGCGWQGGQPRASSLT